jgi:hypothetical protein
MLDPKHRRMDVIAGLILSNRGQFRYPFGPGWARVCLDVMEHIRRRP